MQACNLQIFLFSSPFQNFFFLVGQETISLLIDFIQDFIDAFLGDIGNFFIGLCAGYIIEEFVFLPRIFLLLVGIEQIRDPVEKRN